MAVELLTRNTMALPTPTSALVGVPAMRPVAESNVVHLGAPDIANVRTSLPATVAPG
jgi:hypothetical protein